MPESEPPVSPAVAVTYRWKRRAVQRVRVTWLFMVFVLFCMGHRAFLHAHLDLGMAGKVGSFIGMVLFPTLLLTLWRFGLLPPERVPSDAPPGR